MDNTKRTETTPVIPAENKLAFFLIAFCFGLWGMINMMTDTLVPAVQKIFSIDTAKSSYIQVVNYASYALLAFPAAVLIKRFSYKTGVILGLILLCIGASCLLPAGTTHLFSPLLLTISVMACGLSILETSCNPYILAMGSELTAVRRLNLAQTFNPIGCLLGLIVAKYFILGKLDHAEAAERATWTAEQVAKVKSHELFWLGLPYCVMVLVAIIVLITLLVRRMPEGKDTEHSPHVLHSVARLVKNPRYILGVFTQFFYVAVQVAVWTFIIKYTREAAIFTVGEGNAIIPGMVEADAWYSLMASMVVFMLGRMVCTALMRKFNPASMMAILSVFAIVFTVLAIYLPAKSGLATNVPGFLSFMPASVYTIFTSPAVLCLITVSFCMSLMFPTIYGIALRDLGPEAKIAASGLIMAILGGAAGSFAQGKLIDILEKCYHHRLDVAIRYSFAVPIFCFIIVLFYALKYRAFCATTPTSSGPVGGGH